MLTRLNVRKFKSLGEVTVELPRLAVFFGPNAAGKSNLLDAIQALSWIGNARTLFDALSGPFPVRGHAFEAFSFASGGLSDLLRQESARFSLEADLEHRQGAIPVSGRAGSRLQVGATQYRRRVSGAARGDRAREGDACDRARRIQAAHPAQGQAGPSPTGRDRLEPLGVVGPQSERQRVSLARAGPHGAGRLAHLLPGAAG